MAGGTPKTLFQRLAERRAAITAGDATGNLEGQNAAASRQATAPNAKKKSKKKPTPAGGVAPGGTAGRARSGELTPEERARRAAAAKRLTGG